MRFMDFLFKSKFTNGMIVVFSTVVLLFDLMMWLAIHILLMVSLVLAVQEVAINGKDVFINTCVGVLCLGMYLLLFWMLNCILRSVFDVRYVFSTIKKNVLLLFNKKIVKE
ncbi:hypothetical protein [Staphylococcus aureus]|uniref:hypothetical protein n=1 Tax=Staphylococcus aureus TaxID=1280 RepID=UPI000DF4667F|nr:hypothetical protein [Staphylococcus aureus]MCS4498327.1 hypothetical protein [Staphylococcus aureus]RCV67359.1 hypothetical protein BJL67_11685 [Staphylococcus aureus]RCV73265.1 hypothetical protein BJL68_01285 [Staphylococcus aureus]RCV74012.1 hypothetical protein BJL72_05285 [Staphylococcus aureus]RCV84006.1 hypothetical protein BJL73_05295 [Staphylococcus aureus]